MNREKWEKLIRRAPFAHKLFNKNVLYKTKEEQLAAVKQNCSNIQFIRNPDKDVQLEAVKQDDRSIRFIHNPDREVQLAAVKQIGSSVQFIHDPDKDVQLAAVKQNVNSIQWIIDPCKEVIIHYLLQACPDLLQDPEYDLKEPEDE